MKLLKQAKSTSAKVREIYRQYTNEFGKTPTGDLRCNVCDVLVKCDKNFFVESHRKSKLYQDKLVTTSSSQDKQTYIQLDRVEVQGKRSLFNSSSRYPTAYKLNYPALKFLFVEMGKPLPPKTAARTSLA